MSDAEISDTAALNGDVDPFDALLREIARDDPAPRAQPKRGDVFAERFVVERLAGLGGMGAVYRGIDLQTRDAVAIKVLASHHQGASKRFQREATVLAELSHPAIVRYVAHETGSRGAPFLAMEWLEGESLAERLVRAPLSVEESLDVVRRAGEGLAAVHARGVVHRDVKPSNLFLVGGDPALLKVLDFGVAQPSEGTLTLTQAGALLGTVGYMSPEQAIGSREIDARADVFALGCVLFQCLTGRAAFSGPNAVAVLAKVLSEQPPQLREVRSELSSGLELLVARMLAKNPADRPDDMAAVLLALVALGPSCRATESSLAPAVLTATEQRVVSVILAKPHEARGFRGELEPERVETQVQRIRALAQAFHTEAVVLRGGALLIVLSGAHAATDQAAQAASCALQLARLVPELRVVVATGRAETSGDVPVGAAIDRAAELLTGAADIAQGVAIDRLTADLLTPNFEVRQRGVGLLLVAHSEASDLTSPTLLMGKPTPFVGRDKELQLLELTLRECIEDSVARAVLVTGAPGIGKSRLMRELRGVVARADTARLLFARADPIAAGSALSLVQRLIAYAAGLRHGESVATQQAQLRRYLCQLLPHGEALEGSTEFLGELLGAPTDRPASPALRAARNDRAIMREQNRRAFQSWIAAEARARPLLIVLEDLHWSDLASVNYLGEALHSLSGKSLLLLALARPEVHEQFPRLWPGAPLQELKLSGLTPRAAERFVHATLGEDVDAATSTRIRELADGNAFYLEELIRRVAEGRSDLPETVLAMAQSRLEQVEPEARRTLRAASVFGDACWSGGVAALLGASGDGELEQLANQEILVRLQAAELPGQRRYVFRHALLRDAAYAMLTEHDRTLAHRMAGDWLERFGEKDARTIADHFERGGAKERAVPFIVRAAVMAMDGGDPDGARALAQRGLDLGAAGHVRGVLLTVQATATSWNARVEIEPLLEALSLLPKGDPYWWSATSLLIVQATSSAQSEVATPYVQQAFAVPPSAGLSGPRGMTVWLIVGGLERLGRMELARTLVAMHEHARLDPDADPVFVAWIDIASSTHGFVKSWDAPALERTLLRARRAVTTMEKLGTRFGFCVATCQLAVVCRTLGCEDEATEAATRSLAMPAPTAVHAYMKLLLAQVECQRARPSEAAALVAPLRDSTDQVIARLSRLVSAQILAAQERWAEALAEALPCLDGERVMLRRGAGSLIARAQLGLGQYEAAYATIERAAAEPNFDTTPEIDTDLWLTHAEVLHALGKHADAHVVLRAAQNRILNTAAAFEDPRLRTAFADINSNRRVLALSKAWFGAGTPVDGHPS